MYSTGTMVKCIKRGLLKKALLYLVLFGVGWVAHFHFCSFQMDDASRSGKQTGCQSVSNSVELQTNRRTTGMPIGSDNDEAKRQEFTEQLKMLGLDLAKPLRRTERSKPADGFESIERDVRVREKKVDEKEKESDSGRRITRKRVEEIKGRSFEEDDKRRQLINKRLRERGLESVQLHDFKSIYVSDPKIYDRDITPKAPGKRRLKLISSFNSPKWFTRVNATVSYNRDFKKCPYNECYFDISGSMHKQAAMVLFFPEPPYMPERPPGQIWGHCSWEPPRYYSFVGTDLEYNKWKGVFNWTLGYSPEHDVFGPTNTLGWRARDTLLSDEEYMRFAKRKTRTATWWVSRCNSDSNRDNYAKEMQKYVDIDIYGRCGNMTCKDKSMCVPLLNSTYKFYLSFENSFCKDYVTPKFFRNFERRTLVIPVVRGGFDYEKYFPPNTFVNANNFKNAKDLALYLNDLAHDLPKYANMLKEKDKLMALNMKNDWCDLCEKLHTNMKHKTIADIRKITHRDGLCWNVNDVY